MKPLHGAGDIYKTQITGVKFVKAGRYTTKDLPALKEIFN